LGNLRIRRVRISHIPPKFEIDGRIESQVAPTDRVFHAKMIVDSPIRDTPERGLKYFLKDDMKLYIPALGEQIRLTADWTFGLYAENRNETLMEHISDTRKSWGADKTSIPCTIPAGSILKVDRVFIRKGSEAYNSLSFFWVGKRTIATQFEQKGTSMVWDGQPKKFCQPLNYIPNEWIQTVKKPARPIRFWAKLDDANNIEFEKV